MSAYQRRKGAVGEREVCRILRTLGYEAKRGLQFRGGDADDTPDVIADPFAVEVKTGPSYRKVWADNLIMQAKAATPKGMFTLAWVRPGRGGEKYLMIPEADALELLEQFRVMWGVK